MSGPAEDDRTDQAVAAVSGARPQWTYDRDQGRLRRDVQVGILMGALRGQVVRWPPAEVSDEIDYFCHPDRILVRGDGEQAAQVADLVGGTVGLSPIDGLTIVMLGEMGREEALTIVDVQLGLDVASPDHVFYVTGVAGCCPATEPNRTPDTMPVPVSTLAGGCDGTGVTVSVVDTGFICALVDDDHRWLHDVTGDEEHYDPDHIGPYVGHGSFVAGVVRSMAPQATVRVEGFLADGGAVHESAMIAQLHDSLNKRPDVITMSAGSYTRDRRISLAFDAFRAVLEDRLPGTVMLAAAGNDATDDPFQPAADSDWCVGVGALNPDGSRAPYSNFGDWVQVYARGTDMINAFPKGTVDYHEPPRQHQHATFRNAMASWSGTSFSTPLVAGLIAARMSSTGETGRQAWASLKAIARQTEVGPVLEPAMACLPVPAAV